MPDDENILILLCKFKTENEVDKLNSFLKLHLSHHFLPNIIYPLQSNIPLNINGKIDRTKLFSLYSSNTMNNSSKHNLTYIWQVS